MRAVFLRPLIPISKSGSSAEYAGDFANTSVFLWGCVLTCNVSIRVDQDQLSDDIYLMDYVDPKKLPQKEVVQEFQKEFERLTALDAEWRKYFTAQGNAPLDPQKLESPLLFLCE